MMTNAILPITGTITGDDLESFPGPPAQPRFPGADRRANAALLEGADREAVRAPRR